MAYKTCLTKLGIGLLAAAPFLFTSCQKVQNASALSPFNNGPSAIAEEVTDAATVAPDLRTPVAEERNELNIRDNTVPAPKPKVNAPPAIRKPVVKIKEGIADTGSAVNTGIRAPKIPAPPIPPPPVIKPPVINPPAISPPAPKPLKNTSGIVRLGTAFLVPGDNLHVTLPGEYANLGPISIERLDSSGNALGSPWTTGTQMQIPNPQVPGGKIYFKVP